MEEEAFVVIGDVDLGTPVKQQASGETWRFFQPTDSGSCGGTILPN